MPKQTKHYDLTSFEQGDTYSASADRRRFSIIDNQLWFLAQQIGDGVIDGWAVSRLDGDTVRISPGMGIIDGFLCVTHGHFDVDLPNNRRLSLFMRRKPDIFAHTGAFSEIESVPYLDTTPPGSPASPSLKSKAFNFIEIEWIANSESDFSFYRVMRSEDNLSYESIKEIEVSSFNDEDVIQDKIYYYQIVAVDYNNNESDPSATLIVITDVDERIPNDPIELDILTGNESLQVYWGASNYLVDQYRIVIQPITLYGIPDGSAETVSVSNTTFYHIFSNLINGQLYDITVKSVSPFGFESTGIVVRGQPVYSSGAAEIESINIEDFALDSRFTRLGLNVSWEIQNSEYTPIPDYYLVTIQRDGEIGVPSIYTSNENTIISYTTRIGDQELARDIEEETKYTIRIQTATGDITSNGFVIRIKTRKLRPPYSISNLEIEASYTVKRRSVIATWSNSVSEYAFNRVTVKKIPLDADEEYTEELTITIADNVNYGQSDRYELKTSDIDNMHRYEFYVTTYDIHGNTSQTVSSVKVLAVIFKNTVVGGIPITNSGRRPPVPTQQFGITGNDQATIYWNAADSDIIDRYRVYRGPFSNAYSPLNFELVVETISEVRKYTDYTVENGEKYVYFVTTVDVFGNESPNPSDNYISYPLIYISPRSHDVLEKSPTIAVARNGHDATLTWLSDEDSFDGYQIFRSDGNKYSWKAVGSAGPLATSYTDVAAINRNGDYFYMIRKFRNEGEIVVSRSRLSPAGSLALGIVARSNNNIIIDTTDAYDIKLLIDPIKDEMKKQFNDATHLFYGKEDDRRVRFQNELVVTDWTTLDYQNYSTETNLASTSDYVVYINGSQSAFGTNIERDSGTLNFEQIIFDVSINFGKSEENQVAAPEVMVIFLDVNETVGTLHSSNVESISAAKITKGKIAEENIPQLNHFGRYREKLTPKRFSMTSTNPQLYSGTTPDGTTFYDVIKTDGNRILSATSTGILRTGLLGGNSWDTVEATPFAATKIIYSNHLEMYFAAVGNHVLVSFGGIKWVKPSGMDGVTFVRDLADDGNGNVFATADSGVYRMKPLNFTKLFWEQLDTLNPLDANAYAIAYDEDRGMLIVSGSSSLYESTNGDEWSRVTDDEISVPCHSIFIFGEYTFLVSGNKVWRKRPSDSIFRAIGDFASQCRRGVYFSDDFYVTTDDGLMRSSSDSNVLEDDVIQWTSAFKNLARNGIMPATHALRIIDGKLWMGQDERLYSATAKRSVSIHADIPGVCPTVFVDDSERSVGVYYNNNNNVIFDTRIDLKSTVGIVRSYTQFTSVNGGWADTKFDAEVLVNINGDDIIGPPVIRLIDGRFWRFPPKPWTIQNDPKFVYTAMNQIVMPFFNGRTSNFDKANASLRSIVQQSDAIQILDDIGQTFVPSEMVANLFKELENFKTYIHPELRPFITYPSLKGTINQNGFTALYDVISGEIEIVGGVNKYTKVSLSVKGVSITNTAFISHDEVEESFEKSNSGLTAPMAYVQQSNLVKAGIYQQHLDPGALANGYSYQAVHHAACDSWYSKLMSTIDYEEKLVQSPPTQGTADSLTSGFSIDYPADIIYIEALGEVWVCGGGGIISIDKNTYNTRKIHGSPFYFYNMSLSGGTLYALAEDGLYAIDIYSGIVVKDVNITLPSGFSSVFVYGDTTYISTDNGVYSKRPFEVKWQKVFSLIDAVVRSTSRLTFAVGRSPDSPTDGFVYYSHSGVIWNRSNVFDGILVYSVTQRYNSIYYATDSGLLVEDLSRLLNTSGPSISAAILENDIDNSEIIINDVDADDERAIAVTNTGKWYSMSGDSVNGSGHSRLETIHKVKVVDGTYWLFSDNLVEIENTDRLIRLSTGKALI